MMYKIPQPNGSNGVKIYTLKNQQIGIEYQSGEPHVGKLAFDSALGSMARECPRQHGPGVPSAAWPGSALGSMAQDITIRPRRPDLDRIVAAAKRKLGYDAMPRAGMPPIDDDNDDNTDGDAIVAKLMAFLKGCLTPGDLEDVQSILDGKDVGRPEGAMDRAAAAAAQRRRLMGADTAAGRNYRRESADDEAERLEMFPNWNRLS
jgi:hypothetical protein